MPLTVWGWADPGEKVDVTFRAQRVSTATERDGRWQVSLAPEAAGGPFELTVADSSAPIRLTDVLVGEVWLASGQSNMQWTVARAQDGQAETAPGMSAPRGAPDDPHRPATLFNAMIAPLTQYAIRGVIWYQGETNAVRSWDYQRHGCQRRGRYRCGDRSARQSRAPPARNGVATLNRRRVRR
jgi:hypothetical protein